MEEDQQVTTKEPQQVTTKEPQQVTTKNPKKVAVGRKLAEYNRRKKEEMKAQKQKSEILTSSQYYSVGVVLAVGRQSWLLSLSSKERSQGTTCESTTT